LHKIYTVIKCFNFNLFPDNHITLSKYKTILCISNHDNDRVLTKYKHSKFITWLSDKNSLQKETRGSVGWACVAHLSFCFEQTLYRTFHRCFLPNFGSFGYSVSEEKIFLEINQKQELPVVAMFVNGSGRNEQSL